MAERPTPGQDARSLAQAGFAALRNGKFLDALTLFDRLIKAGQADASIFFATAVARQQMADKAGALQAIDRALAHEGSNFQFLLFKADLLAASGANREATALYLAAVRSVPNRQALSPALRGELERAEQACRASTVDLEDVVRRRLSATDGVLLPRIADTLDLMFGHKQPCVQRPRYFYFPGLAPIPFFDPREFDWVPALEAHTDRIRDELLEVMRDHAAFRPYVEGNPNRRGDRNDPNGMLNNPDWSAFYLWKNGELVEQNAARCPNTVKAMLSVPLTCIPNRSPSVLFSLLRPGAHIPPHNGLINTRLIAHLPLIVPGKCRLRVGNDTREWVAGKVWLFDDTIEHEAWNDSDETRVILLFEVNRPDITTEEQRSVSEIFSAIDAHSGRAPEWEI